MNKLTEDEVHVLSEEYNLADGHAFRLWNEEEETIIKNISDSFFKVSRRNQRQIEDDYVRTFLTVANQSTRKDFFQYFQCFTASTALEVIGNFLRINNLSVSLIEPCFDNLYDIMARHNISMTPFRENMITAHEEQLLKYLESLTSDVIFLVSPNNPTGVHLNKTNFACILRFCAQNAKILILDACFRFYLPENDTYDQYSMIAESNANCIIIEDTGKTWPTLELKGPFFAVSPCLAESIKSIYSDFLLHVSPVSLALMTKFLKLPGHAGVEYIRKIIQTNRSVLYEAVKGTFLEPQEAEFMSVSWLRIRADLSASQLKKELSEAGIHVLTGNQFFWADPLRGEKFIRIALNRQPEMFLHAVQNIAIICKIKTTETQDDL